MVAPLMGDSKLLVEVEFVKGGGKDKVNGQKEVGLAMAVEAEDQVRGG